MVRFGIALYGAMPSDTMESDFVPKTTLTLKTVVSNVKLIRAGDTIGYGCTYVAQKDTKVATLPIGYADGILRSNSDNGTKISINGKLCSIIGRICMDQLMVDVTGLDDLKIGDVAIIFGEGSEIDVQDFARTNNTIPYEIFCNIGARVTRIYKNEFYENKKS
jgi:alanine racemase